MAKKNEHQRVNDILLGPLERPLIQWLVARLPDWVTPDSLTAVSFLASILIGFSYWQTNFNASFLWLASFGFVLNWFGDSLDGSLARYRKIERPKFGYFIDHTVDAFTQFVIMLGLGLSPYVGLKFALFLLVGYFLVSIHTYITIYVRGIFRISYAGFGPTEARVFAIIVNAAFFFVGIPEIKVPLLGVTIYDFVVLVTGVLLIGTYLISGMRQAVELAAQE